MKKLLIILPGCATLALAGVMPIENGRLETNLDGGGHTITNAIFAGTIVLDTSTPIVATSWAEAQASTNVDLNYHDIDHVETLDANRVNASGVFATDVQVDSLSSASMGEIYIADTLNADGHAITGASLVQASAYYGGAGALTGFGGVVSGPASNLVWAAGSIGADELDMGELQTVFLTSVGTARFDNAVIADLSRVTTNYISNSTFPSNAAGWALGGDAYWAADGRIQVLEANSGTLTLSNFNAVAGKAYKLKFKKGTTYSSISVSLGNVTKTVNPDLVGDITDYYYCTGTGALTFAMTVGSIPDIFQYIDNIELYAITSGTMQVVGDLYVDGRFHADGIDGDGTPIDSRSATNNVNMGGHSISNVVQITGGGNNDLFIAPNEECDGPYGTTPYPDLLLQAGCSPDNPGDLCLRSFGNIRFMFEDSASEQSSIIADLPTADHGVTGSLWNDNGLVSLSGRETGTIYYSSKSSFKIHAGTNVVSGGPSIQMMGTNYSGLSPSLNGTKGSMWLMANADNSAATGGYDRAVVIGYYEGGAPHDCLRATPSGLYAESHMAMYGGATFDDEYVAMRYLPTNDPSEYGRLWVSNGVLHVSGY